MKYLAWAQGRPIACRTPNTPPFAGSAVSPFSQPLQPFNYDVFGVRIAAFFANPSIPAGTILRPPQPTSGTYYPCDPTIIATLRAQFGLKVPLTPRDGAAPTLAGLSPQGTPLKNDLQPPEEVNGGAGIGLGTILIIILFFYLIGGLPGRRV